jgi:hypothetical protein
MTLPLRPHRYWGGTTCPGNPWQQWVPGLRNLIEEDDMTPEERIEFDALKSQVANQQVVIDRITGPVLDDATNPISPEQGIWAHIIDLWAHARSPHGGSADGLKRGDKVTLKDGTLE